VCGRFYSKVIELIAAEEADEERRSWRGRLKRIVDAEDVKAALKNEVKLAIAGLNTKARFTLFVIFAFVFALVVTVL
jgi:hypothetical protein